MNVLSVQDWNAAGLSGQHCGWRPGKGGEPRVALCIAFRDIAVTRQPHPGNSYFAGSTFVVLLLLGQSSPYEIMI